VFLKNVFIDSTISVVAASDLLTSAEVARLAGVGPTAIKRWSDSGALPCNRTAGGHRRFRRGDVEHFLASRNGRSGGDDWGDWIDALLLTETDTYSLQARLLQQRARLGSWFGVAETLGALLTEVGRRWEDGRLTVFEEHRASASLARAIAAVAEGIPTAADAPRCLLASVEGEEHTLGLSLVELCLREAGWRCEWLGAPTRTLDVIERVEQGGLAMVALSASASSADAPMLRAVADQVGEVCRRTGVLLVLGGAGAWPDRPSRGQRFTRLEPLHVWAGDQRDRLAG